MAKAILLHRQNFLHEKTGRAQETQIRIETKLCTQILSVLHEAKFEPGGPIRGRRTRHFSLNPSKSCMKCQGGQEKGKASLHVMKHLLSPLNQEKRYFQGIKRSCFHQLCNRTSEEVKTLLPLVATKG